MLIIDEMKIHEDLVFDKHGRNLLGFINLGSINEQLQELEKETLTTKPHENIATHMLTVMVRGVFIKLEFPFASFPTKGLTSYLYNHAYMIHSPYIKTQLVKISIGLCGKAFGDWKSVVLRYCIL